MIDTRRLAVTQIPSNKTIVYPSIPVSQLRKVEAGKRLIVLATGSVNDTGFWRGIYD